MRLSFVILALTSIALAAAPATDLPTMDQLKAQVSAQPQEALKSLAKVIALKGDAAKSYDRYELFCLRGEANLRMKANTMAADSFAAAAKETTDEQKKATARATELLIRRSKPLGYAPRSAPATKPAPGTKPPGPMPIVEEADRKAALAALLADEINSVAPKLKSARSAASLAPIADAARVLGDLRAIELAATGSAEQTKSHAADLGDRAHGLIADALKTMSARTEAVWNSASRKSISTDGYGNQTVTGMWGMTSTEMNDLKQIIGTCEKITPTAQEFAAVTANAALERDAQEAQSLYARAKEVLGYDYANAGRYQLTPPVDRQKIPPPGGAGGRVGVGTGTSGGTGPTGRK